jgi:hypothetical protein
MRRPGTLNSGLTMSSPLPLASHRARSRIVPAIAFDQSISAGQIGHPGVARSYLEVGGSSQARCYLPVGTGGSKAGTASMDSLVIPPCRNTTDQDRTQQTGTDVRVTTGRAGTAGRARVNLSRLTTSSWPRSSSGAVSFAVAARLLPDKGIWDSPGLAEATRQAGDQGGGGVEVRGFEPLASSVRGIFR